MRINRRRGRAQQAKQPQPKAKAAVGAKEPPALEQRLEKLVQLERGTRDLLERREVERVAAEKAESQQRLAAAEAALADAQARKQEQRDTARRLAGVEESLSKALAEVARLKNEVAAAKRSTEEARKAIKPRSEQRIAVAEKALAEARSQTGEERGWRVELEKKLAAQERSERETREKHERELAAAQERGAAEAAQRIAELEQALAEARADAEREREQRAELEQQLEAQAAHEEDLRRSREQLLAEFDLKRAEAERTAAEALETLDRERAERSNELKRILVIEEELKALLASEAAPRDGSRESAVDAPAPEGELAADELREPVPPLFDALGPAHPQSDNEPRTAEPDASTEEEPVEEPSAEEEPSEAEEEPIEDQEEPIETPVHRMGLPKGRRARRARRRSLRGQTTVCVVCTRSVEATDSKSLMSLGWIVVSDNALCPDCLRSGWQLPEGGGLPFRRTSAKQRST